MLDKYLKDLDEMYDSEAEIESYNRKLIEGFQDLEGNERFIFIHSLLQYVKRKGFMEGLEQSKKLLENFK